MRYLLRYHAEYRYSGPVFDQHNVLRVTPATTPLQRVRGFRVVVEPSARTRTYSDYFGTEVVEFNVPGEHERLAITAEGEVVNEEPAAPPDGGWELHEDGRRTRAAAASSCCTPATSRATAASRRCARRSRPTRRAGRSRRSAG